MYILKHVQKQLRKNDITSIGKYHLYNGLVIEQGPNYALAKMIQLWRVVLIQSQNSQTPQNPKLYKNKLSLNVAPATATKSVISNKMFKMAFKGRGYFKPMETFNEETSRALMAGLLLCDILVLLCFVATSVDM